MFLCFDANIWTKTTQKPNTYWKLSDENWNVLKTAQLDKISCIWFNCYRNVGVISEIKIETKIKSLVFSSQSKSHHNDLWRCCENEDLNIWTYDSLWHFVFCALLNSCMFLYSSCLFLFVAFWIEKELEKRKNNKHKT